jgi:hypothetical protein
LQTEPKDALRVALPQLFPKIKRIGRKEVARLGITVPVMPKRRGRKRKHVPGERSAHSCPTCELPLYSADALRAHLALVHHRAALTKTFVGCDFFEHCPRCDLILADVDTMVTHAAFFHKDHLDRLLNPWEFASLYNITLESMIAMPKVLLVKYDDRQSEGFRPRQVTKKIDAGAGDAFVPLRCFVCGLVSQDLSSLQEHLAVDHFLNSLRERCGADSEGDCPLCLTETASEEGWATHVAFAHGKIRDVVLSEKHVQQATGVLRNKRKPPVC